MSKVCFVITGEDEGQYDLDHMEKTIKDLQNMNRQIWLQLDNIQDRFDSIEEKIQKIQTLEQTTDDIYCEIDELKRQVKDQ